MKDITYWKSVIENLHPIEYINLLQAIQDRNDMQKKFIAGIDWAAQPKSED